MIAGAQDAALALVKGWSFEALQTLRQQVPHTGMATQFEGASVQDWATGCWPFLEKAGKPVAKQAKNRR